MVRFIIYCDPIDWCMNLGPLYANLSTKKPRAGSTVYYHMVTKKGYRGSISLSK